jgi:hypothetical protein
MTRSQNNHNGLPWGGRGPIRGKNGGMERGSADVVWHAHKYRKSIKIPDNHSPSTRRITQTIDESYGYVQILYIWQPLHSDTESIRI